MNPSQRRLRLIQWTTGKVAGESIRAILDRPNDFELVGLYAYSAEKVGQDVGDLIGLGRKIGVKATDDIDALIALKPDCAVYMPLHPNVEHMAKLLRAGINVATTASFMTGRGYGEEARRTLEAAAQAGGVSLFGSGINPGWVDGVVATASSMCREVNLVRVTESFNIGMWAGDANQDVLGWGRPAGDPGHAKDIEKATLPFGDAVEAMAHMFQFTVDDIRCDVTFAHATQDLDIPGRLVKKGTVAGILSRWRGFSGGHPVIELIVQWTLADEIAPAWDVAMAYLVEIHGTPQLKFRAEVLPSDMSLPMEELVKTGFIMTAMPVVNAIPAVVAARPGIVTYADLRPVTSVLRPKAGVASEALRVPLREEADPAPAPAASSSGAVPVEGTWKVVIKGPTGPQETQLVLTRKDGVLAGEQSAQGASSPVSEMVLEGNRLSWVNHVAKPIKMKVRFEGTLEGDRMSGKCKPGFMGSFPFTGVKV
ncbi:MAG TPA: hypothetical protein VJM11_02390 [Nevskiaceae bacterium]|nr:hypothetical protein [Nevskiaceae bacterium]